MQLQGGGGRQRGGGAPCSKSLGELATDDNAADACARPRDAGMIQTTGPRGTSPHHRPKRRCRNGHRRLRWPFRRFRHILRGRPPERQVGTCGCPSLPYARSSARVRRPYRHLKVPT
ncbi:hypothetical protein C3489_01570 [Streptomyces sp. Ru71]|nr:hypothetical protein C3489_01570 [Streptomyces sp. Ru71]